MLAEFIQSLPAPLQIVAPAIVAAAILARYVVFAGGLLLIIWLLRRRISPRRLQPAPFTRAQFLREAGWSCVTAGVFAVVFFVAFAIGQSYGVFLFYLDIGEYGWLWFWISVPSALLIHDFYFYWTHRLMHAKRVYKRVHAVHHRSTNPSPLSAFAFHPLEAVIEAGGFLVIALLLPMHPSAFSLTALVMMSFNVLGHSGYEFFPRSWRTHPLLGWFNTSTAHNQHHRTYVYNFGLYTLIWDRLFGTLHPRYAETYDRASSGEARIQDDTKGREAFVAPHDR